MNCRLTVSLGNAGRMVCMDQGPGLSRMAGQSGGSSQRPITISWVTGTTAFRIADPVWERYRLRRMRRKGASRDPPNTIATLPVSLRSSLILGSIIDQSVHNGPCETTDGRFKRSARFQAFDDKPCLSPKRCGVDTAASRELDALHRHLDERSCRSAVQ